MTTTTGTTRKKNERKTPTLLRRFTRDTTTEAVDKESMQDTDTKKNEGTDTEAYSGHLRLRFRTAGKYEVGTSLLVLW